MKTNGFEPPSGRLPLGLVAPPHECDHALPLDGSLPPWLHGSYYQIGPGKFVVGGNVIENFLDGFAMVHRFAISANHISYRNRYLRSRYFNAVERRGRIVHRPFAGRPTLDARDWIRFLLDPISMPADNPIAALSKIGNRLIATNQAAMLEFDPETLGTKGKYEFSRLSLLDALSISTGHCHTLDGGDTLLGTSLHVGRFTLWRMRRGCDARERIANVETKAGCMNFMHAFAITPNFAIYVLSPWDLRPWENVFSLAPLLETLSWDAAQNTRFVVIDHRDGRVAGTYESEPFVTTHFINAFERDGSIWVDLVAYQDPVSAGWHTPLPNNPFSSGEVRRYRLPLAQVSATRDITFSRLTATRLEFPTINYELCNGRPYQFAYACSAPSKLDIGYEQIVKIDVESGAQTVWKARGCTVQEPLLVRHPDARSEDAGIVLSRILNTETSQSFLLFLDASSLTELARAPLPHTVPMVNHGMFVSARHPPEFIG